MTNPGSYAQANRDRGICSIKTDSGKTFRFRTNPNSIRWKYVLNTHVEDTYGGRVIQILSARIDQLTLEVEAGWGGWPYVVKAAYFLRDMMNEQRSGKPATFEYTTRNWKLKVFAVSIPFADTVGQVNKKIAMTFNVVEDSNNKLSSETIGAELDRLQDGIGYQRNTYNSTTSDPIGSNYLNQGVGLASSALEGLTGWLGGKGSGSNSGPTASSNNGLGFLGGLG